MGWASGGEVFDPVARTLIELGTDDNAKTRICSVLIDGLQDRGWDTESESLGQFAEDPAIVAAFRERGILIKCHAEHPTKPWQCEEEQKHTGDHKDYNGRTWPRTVPPDDPSSVGVHR